MTEEYKYQCIRCKFNTNYESLWNRHVNTEMHKTGKKKIRSDKICIEQCPECDYQSKINTNMRQHILNNHVSKEEKEKEFTYYCKYCDFGAFSKPLYTEHIKTKKHRQIKEILSKIVNV
jgi:hypothetical protein